MPCYLCCIYFQLELQQLLKFVNLSNLLPIFDTLLLSLHNRQPQSLVASHDKGIISLFILSLHALHSLNLLCQPRILARTILSGSFLQKLSSSRLIL